MIKSLTPKLLYNDLSVLDHSQQVWIHIVGYDGYDDYNSYDGDNGYATYKLWTNNFVKVHMF